MKGFPIGSLCVLTKTTNGINVGGIVEVISDPFLGIDPTFDYGPLWVQEILAITFKQRAPLSPHQCYAQPISEMRLLTDPDAVEPTVIKQEVDA